MLNLFAVAHLYNFSNSLLQTTLDSAIFVQLKDTVKSSANSTGTKLSEILGRSFIKNMNKRGPKIEPWGTPMVIGTGEKLHCLYGLIECVSCVISFLIIQN